MLLTVWPRPSIIPAKYHDMPEAEPAGAEPMP